MEGAVLLELARVGQGPLHVAQVDVHGRANGEGIFLGHHAGDVELMIPRRPPPDVAWSSSPCGSR